MDTIYLQEGSINLLPLQGNLSSIPAGVEKGLAALPSLRTGRETFASSGSPEKEMVL